MKAKLSLTGILFILIFISCNKTKDSNYKALQSSTALEDKQASQGFYQTLTTDSAGPTGNGKPVPAQANVPNTDWDKKIIKTATLKLEVPDFKKYNESVRQAVKQFGGYIAQEEQNLSDEKYETVIAIKVPVDQFENIIDLLPAKDGKVIERKITTDDVTGEVVDTKSRLEAKKQMRLKYLDFLKQSKNMEEVLQVQNEINAIQEEIEAAAGRVNYLSHQAAFSTINLTFYQPLPGFKPVDTKPTFVTRLVTSFKTGVEWFADIFVALMSIWPLILVMLIAIFLWKRSRTQKPIRQNV
jgi:hypothetical protein